LLPNSLLIGKLWRNSTCKNKFVFKKKRSIWKSKMVC